MITLIAIGVGAGVFLLERKLKTKGVHMTKRLSVEEKAARAAERKAKREAKKKADRAAETAVIKATIKASKAADNPNTSELCQFATKLEKPIGQETLVVIGNTGLHGSHLISNKMFEIVKYVLTVMEPQSGIFSIIYDGDGNPIQDDESVMAMLYPDTMTIIFNLEHHWEEALRIAMEDETNCLSLRCLLWYNCLISLFHEIQHAKTVMAAENKYAIVWDDAKEAEATKFAEKRLIELAKAYIVEMPINEEDVFFGARFEKFREFLDTCDAPWADFQRRLYDSDIACSVETKTGERIDVYSFKEFLRQSCDTLAEQEDASWGNKASMIITDAAKVPDAVPQENTLVTPPAEPAIVAPSDDGYDDTEPPWVVGDEETPIWDDVDIPGEATPPAQQFTPPAQPLFVTPGETVTGQAFVNPVVQAMANGPIVATEGKPAHSGGGFKKGVPVPCAPLDIPIPEVVEIVKTVYLRLYEHIFSKCGFCSHAENETTFNNAGAVYEGVFIGDIPNVNKVFLKMEVTDEVGNKKTEDITTHIKGQVFKNSFMPGYWLHLNCGGMMKKRTLVPQNPNKMKSPGVLSPMALKVRSNPGLAVMWGISEEYEGQPSEMLVKIESQPGKALVTYTPFPFRK